MWDMGDDSDGLIEGRPSGVIHGTSQGKIIEMLDWKSQAIWKSAIFTCFHQQLLVIPKILPSRQVNSQKGFFFITFPLHEAVKQTLSWDLEATMLVSLWSLIHGDVNPGLMPF